MYFTASYDSAAKVITAAVVAILALVALFLHSIAAVSIAAVIVALSYAWSPRGYRVEGRAILVERLIGPARIPLEGVREVRAATSDDFAGCIRLFGNGGVFGYYGLFRTSRLGKSTWYLTNRNRAVVVVTQAKTALFSPDDMDSFLASIRGSVPVAPGSTERPVLSGGLAAPVRHANATGMVIACAIGILGLIAAGFALLYSPGPPSYTLTRDSLAIHSPFFPTTVYASNVDVNGIRVVDFDVNTQWRPVERTDGFANAHYKAGTFRLASGQHVRMYRTNGKQLVLLPPKGSGTPVLLETQDPQKFVAAVRQLWSGSPS